MAGRIYLLNDGSELIAMEETPYDSEKLLQLLLADHPDLLAGEQVDVENPRRWLLVTREMSIPGDEDGAGQWSLDHLFLDQDAIPTLVEVKRSNNTGIRRKVVGQMLDYAANAVAYWPVDDIKAKFEKRCEKIGEDPDEALAELLDKHEAVGEFWQQVKTNLQAGRIRMVFVADEIPAELRRIVEFMNEQMDPAEVIAIEIRQFISGGLKTLVPRVLGQTESARTKKGTASTGSKTWDEATFMKVLCETKGTDATNAAKALLDWITPRVTHVSWSRGKKYGGFFPTMVSAGNKYQLFKVSIAGKLVIGFDWLKKKAPFTDEALRRELLNRINQALNTSFDQESIRSRVRVPVEKLADLANQEKFKLAIDWMIDKIRTANDKASTR
jgi:hypothetical protein